MAARTRPIILLLAAGSIALAACSSSSGGKRTPTASLAASPTRASAGSAVPGTPVGSAIRDIDVAGVAAVRKLETDAPGVGVDASAVLYGDLTGDGNEEAVVPVTLTGNQRTVGFVVLTMDATATDGQGVKALLTVPPGGSRGGLALAIQGGKLIETQAAPGPDDPECCPSVLKVTTYAWDGAALAVASSQTVVNPAGGVKGTPPVSSTP